MEDENVVILQFATYFDEVFTAYRDLSIEFEIFIKDFIKYQCSSKLRSIPFHEIVTEVEFFYRILNWVSIQGSGIRTITV